MNPKSLFVAAALLVPMVGFTHHSFAMFDQTRELELKNAVVKEWQWTSPHVWLYLLVPNGTANPDKYTIEGGNPGALRREGFKKGTFAPNDKVTVYVAPLKSGEKGGAMNAVRLANGTLLGTRMADRKTVN
jgi:hypothetical protein